MPCTYRKKLNFGYALQFNRKSRTKGDKLTRFISSRDHSVNCQAGFLAVRYVIHHNSKIGKSNSKYIYNNKVAYKIF